MLRHPRILVLGSSEAAMLLRNPRADSIDALVSIYGQREYALEAPGIHRKLELHFDDVEVADLNDPVNGHAAWARQRWAAAMGRPMQPPTIDDAKAIVEFARSIAEVSGTVLCQCQGGVSRSAAAALLCLAAWTDSGDERYCIDHLLRVRRCAAPHRDLVVFGDKILGRGGKLVEAIADLNGQPSRQGTVTIQQLPRNLSPESGPIINLVRIWRDASRENLQFLLDLHSETEDCQHLANVILQTNEVWVAEVDGAIVGFIAFANGWVRQLYVAPRFQRRGIGTELMKIAKRSRPALQLWVFDLNLPAIRFYEREGFRIVERTDGASNAAKQPDLRMQWRDQGRV